MIEIKSPNKIIKNKNKTIFLAGSIEMGKASDWQSDIVKNLKNKLVTILNPRRDSWNSKWKQEITNKKFKKQVEWELRGLSVCDHIVMYFDPETKSPVTLLELGLFASSKKILLVCPKGFWRKGNVDVVCKQYKIKQFSSLNKLCDFLQILVKNI